MTERKAFILQMWKERPVISQPSTTTPITDSLFGTLPKESPVQVDEQFTTPFYKEVIKRYRLMGLTETRILSIMERIRLEMPKAYAFNPSVEEGGCCGICITDVKEDDLVYQLDFCGHILHRDCLDPWMLQGDKTCPMCRHIFLTCL